MSKNYLDKAGVIYYLVKIKNYISGSYVAKDGNKTLTTNDFTNSLKEKLDNIEAGANKTVVDSSLSATSENSVQNKIIKAALDTKQNTLTYDDAPTQNSENLLKSGVVYNALQNVHVDIDDELSSVSENAVQNKIIKAALDNKQNTLSAGSRVSINNGVISASSEINDSSTTAQNTWSAEKINTMISALGNLRMLVVNTLPTENISTTTIYLLPKTTAETDNVFDEYIYVNNAWELIGSTEIDLSGYLQESDLVAITNAEIDAMFE